MREMLGSLPKLSLFCDGERGAAENMAMDEALLRNVSCPVLRFYRWLTPTVSLGYFCSWADTKERHGGDIDYVRRWTGGGTVEHGQMETTYSLVLPAACPWGRLRAPLLYQSVHTALAAALRECGTRTDSFTEANTESGGACFERPVREDLLVDGNKIAGAAIRHSACGVLLQGSVQGIAWPDLAPGAFARTLADADGVESWHPGRSLDESIVSLVNSRYGRAEWTKRI